jgi:hypothetical protein
MHVRPQRTQIYCIIIYYMSVSQLEVPNSFNLFANSLTLNSDVNESYYYRVDQNPIAQILSPGSAIPLVFSDSIYSANFPAPTLGDTTYTIPISGFYNISYSVCVTKQTGTGQIYTWIQPSSSFFAYATSNTNQFGASALTLGPPVSNITYAGLAVDRLSGSALVPLNAGDTIQIQIYQTTGATQLTAPSASSPTVITIDFAHGF